MGSIGRVFRARQSNFCGSSRGCGYCHPSTPINRFSHAEKNKWGNRPPGYVELYKRLYQDLARPTVLPKFEFYRQRPIVFALREFDKPERVPLETASNPWTSARSRFFHHRYFVIQPSRNFGTKFAPNQDTSSGGQG
ncbi:MAG: hypothetical protein ACREDV_08675 [Methylocella sp.]